MFCPTCGQAKASGNTSFCPRCGTPLVDVAQLAANRGSLFVLSGSEEFSPRTPRRRGLRQSLRIFFLALLLIPILTIIVIATDSELSQIAIVPVFLAICALLRAVFALLFQPDKTPDPQRELARAESIEDLRSLNVLPSQTIPWVPAHAAVSGKIGYSTTEPGQNSPSVTEGTTSLLENGQA